MILLGYFLVAWFILLGIYAIIVLLTLMQMFRHGMPSAFTYISTFVFVAVIAGVVLGCGTYFLTVDWNTGIQILPSDVGIFKSRIPLGTDSIDIPLE